MEKAESHLRLPRDKEIAALAVALEVSRARARESGSREALEPIRAADKALVAAITEGAVPCPDCGNAPHGMIQARGLKRGRVETYLCIGCRVCRDQWVDGPDRATVVTRWNLGERDSPNEEEK